MQRVGGCLVALMVGLGPRATAAQPGALPAPEAFGYRHLVVMFGRDSVDVLVLSQPGEAAVRKPLLLWVQGSLPTPLVLYDQQGPYPVFPFHPKEVLRTCHLAIIGKPGIALVANVAGQNPNQLYSATTPPAYYCQRNYLAYYVQRDVAVLRHLKKQPWVDAGRVVVAGHSEGSTIAAHLAAVPGLVSRAVYLSGNPLGRLLSMLAQARQAGDTASATRTFRRWAAAVADPAAADCVGDDNRNTYSFSMPLLPVLLRARVPIFVGYGTQDRGVAGDDYLRLEAIRRRKTNFTFRAYAGREHNFFGVKDGQVNYDDFYWDAVGAEFLRWAGLLPR